MTGGTNEKYINFVKKTRFLPFSWVDISKIKLTYEGAYSLTPFDAAWYMIKLLRQSSPTPLEHCKVLECFAGHGGDTISLMHYGRIRNIVCFEYNYIHRQNLKSNVSLYFPNNNIKISEDGNVVDYIQWLSLQTSNTPHYDIIYMDPPWGGQNYKNDAANEIQLKNNNGETITISHFVKLCIAFATTIVLKLPPNFDTSVFKGFYTLEEHFYQKPDIKYVIISAL